MLEGENFHFSLKSEVDFRKKKKTKKKKKTLSRDSRFPIYLMRSSEVVRQTCVIKIHSGLSHLNFFFLFRK